MPKITLYYLLKLLIFGLKSNCKVLAMKFARQIVLFSFVILASASQGGGKDESAEIEAYRLARLGYLLESAKNEHPVEPPDDKESIEFEDEFDCPTKPGSDMDYIQDIAQERY